MNNDNSGWGNGPDSKPQEEMLRIYRAGTSVERDILAESPEISAKDQLFYVERSGGDTHPVKYKLYDVTAVAATLEDTSDPMRAPMMSLISRLNDVQRNKLRAALSEQALATVNAETSHALGTERKLTRGEPSEMSL